MGTDSRRSRAMGTLLYPGVVTASSIISIWCLKFPSLLPPSCVNSPAVVSAMAFSLDPDKYSTWYQEWVCPAPSALVLLEYLRYLSSPGHQFQSHGPMWCSEGRRDVQCLCGLDYGKNRKSDVARISCSFLNSCNFFLPKFFHLNFNM